MKILLIDDNPEDLDDLKDLMIKMGYECITQNSSLEAQKIYETKQKEIDVVITDYRMPYMNGIELIKKIREINKNVRIIMITAFSDINSSIEAINNKVYAFFPKPMNVTNFMNSLRDIEQELKLEQEKNEEIKLLKAENVILKNILKKNWKK